MTRQSIPNVVRPCPPPCDGGQIVIDDDMPPGLMFDVERHEACGGAGIEDQAKYAPLDRIRRIIGRQIGQEGLEGRVLDQLAREIGEEFARIVCDSAPAIAEQCTDDDATASRILVAINMATAPFRRPLTYASCIACHASGCARCERRGFVPAREYAHMSERPLV